METKKYRVSWMRATPCSVVVEATSEEEAKEMVEEGVANGDVFPDEEGDSHDTNFEADEEN